MTRGAFGWLVLASAMGACMGSRPASEDSSTEGGSHAATDGSADHVACVGPNPAQLCASASRPCIPSACSCFSDFATPVWECTGDCRTDVDCPDSGSDSR